MIVYIIRRLLWLPVLLIAVSFLTFALGLHGPGDPCQVRLGQHVNPEALARCRHQEGLDRPLATQYLDYVRKALHGDFGLSLKYQGQPVGRLIAKRLWVTVQLNAVALGLGMAVGIPLGVIAALKANSWLDYAIVAVGVAGVSLPTFTIAPILSWFLAVRLHLLPTGGWDGIFSTKIIMPALVLASGVVTVFVRQTRANMLEEIEQDYVRTARAKGLRERAVILDHALRNALTPLFTIFGLLAGGLVGGSFITELIFGIPGIGRLAFEAFFARDYPVITALTLVTATSYAMASLLVDIGYSFLDPRIGRE
ncbi:MAG: ABC transporter permease [Chloroflexota bacterium]|nr:ABC transporter permease [Chloroflexota bacterium]